MANYSDSDVKIQKCLNIVNEWIRNDMEVAKEAESKIRNISDGLKEFREKIDGAVKNSFRFIDDKCGN